MQPLFDGLMHDAISGLIAQTYTCVYLKNYLLSASDEVKAWNAAVDLLKAEKRQRTKNGPL